MVKPKITPHQLNIYTEPLIGIYRHLEQDIFEKMTRRLITSKDYGADHVLQWQVERMQELRILNDETIRELSRTTGVAEKEITKVIHDVGIKTIDTVDLEVRSAKQLLPMPTDLDSVLESYANQTFREFDNYVNQTLITTNHGRGTVAQTYQNIVEETTSKVLAGQITINKAVAETVTKWRKKGIESGFVDKGGHPWSMESYARTVLRSTANNTYNELRTSRMDDYGAEFVLVNSLPDAREMCSYIQGGVASMKRVSSDSRYPSIYDFGYGDPDGIRGINCRHILMVYFPDINFNNEVQYDQEEAAARGEITQGQRRLEREIRQSKQNLKLAEITGEQEVIDKYKKQIRHRQAKVREYVKQHDLPRFYEREQIY